MIDEPLPQIGTPAADALVLLAVGGNADAFASLYRGSVGTVLGFLRWKLRGDESTAEDLTTDAYMRAMRSLGKFEGSSREFQAWVVRIANNLFLDLAKSARKRREISTDTTVDDHSRSVASSASTEEEAIGRVQASDIDRAIDELTVEQAEVVRLRFMHGLSVAETASALEKSEGAVKASQHRALVSLAKVLKARGIEFGPTS